VANFLRNRLPHIVFLVLAFATQGAVESDVSRAAVKGLETDHTWGVTRSDRDQANAAIQDLGAQWVRLTMSWADIEPQQKGSYAMLSHYDAAIASAAASGARIVITVYTSPTWASGLAEKDSPPRNAADYADFMRFAATRWGDKVDAWEIWNEQNLWGFWSTGPDPAEYARLLKAAYPAVKGADPSALVVYGGVSFNDHHYIRNSYAFEPNLGDYYDVMATHPYTPGNAPEDVWYDTDGQIHKQSFAAYREVREEMVAHGDDDKPIWFTEFGWSTNTVQWGTTQAQQADYLARALRCVEQDPYVQVAIWYIYRNHHWAQDADTWVDQLGLVNSDHTRKPAYDAFKAYQQGAGGCTYNYPEQPKVSVPPPADSPVPVPSQPAPSQPTAPTTLPTAPTPAPAPSVTPVRLPATTFVGPAQPAPTRAPAMLSVQRAQVVADELFVRARVASGATGLVHGLVARDGVVKRFSVPVGADGRIAREVPLPDTLSSGSVWVLLSYAGDSRFANQWVYLQAAPLPGRLRLDPVASTSTPTRTATVAGRVNPLARGRVALVLGYRGADGQGHLRKTTARIVAGRFEKTLDIPRLARTAVVNVVFLGDPERGIGGGTRTVTP
jgi:hypothetical protein